MVDWKELFFGNYKNEDVYTPNLIARIKNRISSIKENGKACSCGIRSYCIFHYCFPNESEKLKIKEKKE